MTRAWLAVALGVLAFAAPAQAFYGNGAQIVSADFGRLEQGDDTTLFNAISGNGRYAVFQTRARNFFADDDPDPPGQFRSGGIFRADMTTRALVLVADGDFRDEDDSSALVRGASNPSVSESGRFVAFSTAQQLIPADTNGNVDVYVRDMNVPIRGAGAFDLVSARDGGDVPATYGPLSPSTPGLNPGSEVTRGAAISSDGNRVAFRVTQPASDLPARASADTPPNQLFMRNREANTTTLVTRTMSDGSPAGGAVGPAGISADGTTVVWTGQNAATQTRFIDGENADPGFFFYLWQRTADGPAAPTRRITGVSDPDDPACSPSGPLLFDTGTQGPCYGPLAEQEGVRSGVFTQLPALSGDGRRVAFLTGTGPRPNGGTQPGLDLYLTDMSPGRTRKASTVELTREGTAGSSATDSPLGSISMSANGRYVVLTTVRSRFSLPALTFTGSSRAGAPARDVYAVDLTTRTIERVHRSASGGDANADATVGASVSADGGRIGFTSAAANLFFGDANQRADAFVVSRQAEPVEAPPPPPAATGGDGLVQDPDEAEGPRVTARSKALSGGRVEITAFAPEVGGLKAEAFARVGKPRKRRTLATASGRARKRGRVKLVLRTVRRYRGELRRRKKIAASVRVTFTYSRGGRRLRTSVRVTVRQKLPRSRAKR